MAALQPGERVVDGACGTGVVSRLAAERVGATGSVVGVDVNPAMLGVARSAPAPPGASIDWREANAEALPLPDASFDVVLCQLGLMFVADRSAALREIRRVLAPGGRVAITVPGTMEPLMEAMAESLARNIDPAMAGFVGAVFSLHDPIELEGLLRDAGFADVTAEVTTLAVRLPEPRDFLWQYVHGTPLGAAVAAADDARREAVEREVVARWQELMEDGHLVLRQPNVFATGRA